MICLIHGGAIAYGPAPWDFRAILEHLIVAGFDLVDGILIGPDGSPLGPFPDAEPQGPLALPGFTILPAVEVDEPAPEGRALAGREPVILADRVELRPVWADIPPPPPPPPLPDVKDVLKARIGAALEKYFSALYPNIKAWAVAVEAAPFGQPERENLRENVAMLRSIGGEAVLAIDACQTHEELAAVAAELEAEYAGYI